MGVWATGAAGDCGRVLAADRPCVVQASQVRLGTSAKRVREGQGVLPDGDGRAPATRFVRCDSSGGRGRRSRVRTGIRIQAGRYELAQQWYLKALKLGLNSTRSHASSPNTADARPLPSLTRRYRSPSRFLLDCRFPGPQHRRASGTSKRTRTLQSRCNDGATSKLVRCNIVPYIATQPHI